MKRLVKLWEIAMLVAFLGCSSPKVANRYHIARVNQELSHWLAADSDSFSHAKKQNLDLEIGNYNVRRLRDNLDKDKDSPYWGESIYYMLQDLFQK